MIDKIDIQTRARSIAPVTLAVGILASPVYALMIIAIYAIWRKKIASVIPYVMLCGSIVSLVISLTYSIPFRDFKPDDVVSWLFGLSAGRYFLMFFCFLICSLAIGDPVDEALIQKEVERRESQYRRLDHLPLENRTHAIIVGTTGSGKSTCLNHVIKDSIDNGEELYIISGKNGTRDPRSLLNFTKAYTALKGVPMCIVSANKKEPDRMRYNPLEGMEATELSDALISMSTFSEAHYEDLLAMWFKVLVEVLNLAQIPLSLKAILDIFSFDRFSALVRSLCNDGTISKDTAREYLEYKDIAEEVKLCRGRYLNIMAGEGKVILGDHTTGFTNASRAREMGAVFFVDLDSFRHKKFTRTLGRMAIQDLNHLIDTDNNKEVPKRIVLDELGAFANENEDTLTLYSQSRAFNFQIVSATQSIADIRKQDKNFAERLLENCGQYVVMQMNATDDAETMAGIIGTRYAVETTRKSSYSGLSFGGEGTKKVVREYRVPPDLIKSLPPLNAVYYEKRDPETVSIIHIPFINLPSAKLSVGGNTK